ncbi:SAM-dependent methyltransferase [Spirillospora sp. CA-255316]
MGEVGGLSRVIDAGRANDARVCDYAWGGKDNFAVDRRTADALVAELPETLYLLPEMHGFRRRALDALLEAGVRQFLDIGCGLPTRRNAHDIVHAADPHARVVYTDVDAVAVTHFQALLPSDVPAWAFQGDVREPAALLSAPELTRRLDLDRPVGVLLTGVLHHLTDGDDPRGVVAALSDALAPGGHLVLCDISGEPAGPGRVAAYRRVGEKNGLPVNLRGARDFAGYFDGLDLLDPGVVQAAEWRPDGTARPPIGWLYAGVGRKA